MIPVSYYNPDEVSSPKFAFAFARGCNGDIAQDLALYPGPVALFGSPSRWPVLRKAQAEGRDWYYGDHGYFGRGKYFRITKNAYQHDGTGNAGPERFERFRRPIQPWNKRGRHILVCPNSDIYMGLHGLNGQQWREHVHRTILRHTKRTLVFRTKQDSRHRPIQVDLQHAFACVVFSSASAIDALIAGVPVFSLAPFAATARMGLSDLAQIDHPIYPEDRAQFLWNLAANQWTPHEMFTGQAWRELQQQGANRAAA